MTVALLLPRLLDRIHDRSVMLGAASLMTATLFAATGLWAATHGRPGWPLLIGLWCLFGVAYAGLVTPGGRLLRRSADSDDLPFLFAAQFSLSHVCWLVAYPLAGWVGARLGLGSAFVALSGVALLGLSFAWRAWPRHDPDLVEHGHPELSADHPHLIQHRAVGGKHAHSYRIDELHLRWPQ
jgi:MFS family permease